MYLDQILTRFHLRTPRPHRPAFHVRRETGGWRVFDGERALAFFMPLALDIWAFSPSAPDEIANPEAPGKVVDLHTVHNSFINFGAHGWPRHWFTDPRGAEGLVRWHWEKDSGRSLRASVRVAAPDGETALWRLGIWYDPRWGRYRYVCEIAARKLDPDALEPFNLMLAGALACRPAERRWTHSIWENPDGQLRRIVHSNALFMGTDYGNFREGSGPWRWRAAPYPRAWIGYAAHRSFNPAVLVHATSVPLSFATCSQLFDEHLVWNRAGQDNLGRDGYFHYRMTVEVVNLPATLAQRFLEAASDPARPRRWRHEQIALPFAMDCANSFEDRVDPWAPEECPVLLLPKGSDGPVTWARDAAHSGRRSIRLRGQNSTRRLELFPCGAVCRVQPHRRYRLHGWIRTREVARFARLELATYEYTYANVIATAQSAPVSGTRDWTEVSVELDSGDEAYLMPRLVLYGAGTAWFDDVGLSEA
jgi:hypothetical protein